MRRDKHHPGRHGKSGFPCGPRWPSPRPRPNRVLPDVGAVISPVKAGGDLFRGPPPTAISLVFGFRSDIVKSLRIREQQVAAVCPFVRSGNIGEYGEDGLQSFFNLLVLPGNQRSEDRQSRIWLCEVEGAACGGTSTRFFSAFSIKRMCWIAPYEPKEGMVSSASPNIALQFHAGLLRLSRIAQPVVSGIASVRLSIKTAAAEEDTFAATGRFASGEGDFALVGSRASPVKEPYTTSFGPPPFLRRAEISGLTGAPGKLLRYYL